jgi:hypothetical protein
MPVIPQKNDKAIDANRAHYVKLYAPTTSWSNIESLFNNLPRLVAYWPMNDIDENTRTADRSHLGRELGCTPCPTSKNNGLISYLDFVRASSHFLYRGSEPGLEIEDSLTIGGWLWFDTESTGNATGLLSKWLEAGNERSYVLYKTAGNAFTFSISTDGTAVTTVGDVAANYAISKWFFIVGRFAPSSQLALFVNGIWYTNVAAIPATIHSNQVMLNAGRYNESNYLDGRMCHSFLCSSAVPNVFIEALYAHTKALFMSKI